MHFRNYPCRRNREVRKHVINSTFTVYGGCSVVLVLRRMKHEEGEAQGTALHQIRTSARGDREVHIQSQKRPPNHQQCRTDIHRSDPVPNSEYAES